MRIINNTQVQIDANKRLLDALTAATAQQTATIQYNAYVDSATVGTAVNRLYSQVADGGPMPSITTGRTITFNNTTAATDLDLYLTVGGTSPQPIALLTTIAAGGLFGSTSGRRIPSTSYVWDIPETYNWNGNFTCMPAGSPLMQYNAGPTIAEFGLNQVWTPLVPNLRDTFDISTVPSGIGTGANNGPRATVVALSQAAGFSVQQSYNYNVGVQIVPTPGALTTQTVTCIQTNGDSANSIGYPNDTAYPKQQTGSATGSYTVNFMDPVVSLP
jgi:hypothetical protein